MNYYLAMAGRSSSTDFLYQGGSSVAHDGKIVLSTSSNALDPNIPQTESRRMNPESMAKGTPIDIAAQGMIRPRN